MGVRKIEAGAGGGRISFNDTTSVDPGIVIRMIQQMPRHYKLDGSNRLRFMLDLEDPEQRISAVGTLLDKLTRETAAA